MRAGIVSRFFTATTGPATHRNAVRAVGLCGLFALNAVVADDAHVRAARTGAAPEQRKPAGIVNVIRIRPTAMVRGDTLTLGDVLWLAQCEPQLCEQIAGQPLDSALRAPAKLVVTHAQVVGRLDELGVNLSRLLVGGALECEVTLERPAADGAAADGADAAEADDGPLLRTASDPETNGTTLADSIRTKVRGEFAQDGGAAEIEFERAGREFLELTSPPWDFEIAAAGGGDAGKTGLREFRVTIRRDGRFQRSAEVFAQVRLVQRVVVAKRPLGIGNYIKREDLELQTRIFDRAESGGTTNPDALVGQQVKRFVPEGQLVRSADVKPVDLVQRSRPVSILGSDAHVQLRMTGIALDSGSYGDTVRVRIGDSRKQTRELRGVVTGAGKVQLSEE
jgi:flagella basal body P-ring formation protein FlgA